MAEAFLALGAGSGALLLLTAAAAALELFALFAREERSDPPPPGKGPFRLTGLPDDEAPAEQKENTHRAALESRRWMSSAAPGRPGADRLDPYFSV